jgi:hypothetical protein
VLPQSGGTPTPGVLLFPRETAFVGADVELVGIRLYPGWDDIAAYARNHGEKPVRLAGDTAALLHFIHGHRRVLELEGGLRLAGEIFLGNTVNQTRGDDRCRGRWPDGDQAVVRKWPGGGAGRGAAWRVAWPGCAEAGAAQPGSAPSRGRAHSIPAPAAGGSRRPRRGRRAHQLRRPLDGRENPGGRLRTHQPHEGFAGLGQLVLALAANLEAH